VADVVLDRITATSAVDYLNGLGIDDKLRQTSAGVPLYFTTDHLGSTTALTGANGAIVERQQYEAFGQNGRSGLTRYGYTGREKDEATGLLYYRARWYDPQVGRFVSEDPIGFRGGDANFYNYAVNDPINLTDPDGNQFRADRDRPGDQYPGMTEPYDPKKAKTSLGDLARDLGDGYNPWIGVEGGGNFHIWTVGGGVSFGTEINLLTGQICLFRKTSVRVGMGFFAGIGLKGNLGVGDYMQKEGAKESVEGNLDISAGLGGKLKIKGAAIGGRGVSGSNGDAGVGFGPGVGKGFSVGLDGVTKTIIKCWNNPCK
jgi:RHS repeat-associated protein